MEAATYPQIKNTTVEKEIEALVEVVESDDKGVEE